MTPTDDSPLKAGKYTEGTGEGQKQYQVSKGEQSFFCEQDSHTEGRRVRTEDIKFSNYPHSLHPANIWITWAHSPKSERVCNRNGLRVSQ